MPKFLLFLRRPALWVMAVLLAGCTLESCQLLKSCTGSSQKPAIDEKLYPIRWNSATIQLASPISDEQIRVVFIKASVAAKAKPALKAIDIQIRRCSCDTALVAITLPNNYTINGSGDPVTVQTGTTGASGGVDLPDKSLAAVNYRIETFDDPKEAETDRYQGKAPNLPVTTKTVSIGVFDSGLLENGMYLSGSDWKFPTRLCSLSEVLGATPQQVGYSFLSTMSSATYTDDHQYHHGSRVAHLIASQFVGSDVRPQIIPFKVLDSNNQGDMFGLLCAMETARLNKVQVYNLSLGYYGDQQPLLKKYIEKSLADDPKRYIVVAAGNRPQGDTATNHNLGTMFPKFYPAAFGADFDRVIVVTTVQNPPLPNVDASLRQNYSKEFALGVRADTQDGFNLAVENLTIFGSSFAAPILTGQLALWIGRGEPFPTDKLRSLMTTGTAGSGGRLVRGNQYIKSRP